MFDIILVPEMLQGASTKGGPQTPGGAFVGAPKSSRGHFRGAEGASKIGKILRFHRKIQHLRRKSTIFKKIFQNSLSKKFFLQKIFFKKNFFSKKNFFFKKIYKIVSKIFKNCRLKMQKSRFSGKIDGLLKPPEGIFSPHQNHLEGKIGKGPPYNISDQYLCQYIQKSFAFQKNVWNVMVDEFHERVDLDLCKVHLHPKLFEIYSFRKIDYLAF